MKAMPKGTSLLQDPDSVVFQGCDMSNVVTVFCMAVRKYLFNNILSVAVNSTGVVVDLPSPAGFATPPLPPSPSIAHAHHHSSLLTIVCSDLRTMIDKMMSEVLYNKDKYARKRAAEGDPQSKEATM